MLLPKLILSPQGRRQSLSLEINPVDNAEQSNPHDIIDDSQECDEKKEISLAHRLSQALVHFATAPASLFTDHRMSGLPIRARYKHLKTICEQICDNYPTDSSSSCLN